jgi:hypothetical protein
VSWAPVSKWGKRRERERETKREIARLVEQRRRKRLQDKLPRLDAVEPFATPTTSGIGGLYSGGYDADKREQRRRRVDEILFDRFGIRPRS